MKRRTVLKLAAGAAGMEGVDGDDVKVPSESDLATGPVSATLSECESVEPVRPEVTNEDGVVSLRGLGRRMDPQRPPTRIRGNEPPWAGRPEASAEDLGSYGPEGDRKEYVKNIEISRAHAYDMGMVNRDEQGVATTDLSEKGILEHHRWPGVGDSIRTQTTGREEPSKNYSLRSVVDRHRQGTRHKILWQNVKMPKKGGDANSTRAKVFGALLGDDEYDIVGMCEVSDGEYLDKLVKYYTAEHSEDEKPRSDWTGSPPSDMGGFVVENDEREARFSGGMFRTHANYGTNKEGFQRIEIELPRERFGNGVGFEIITTHLDSYDGGSDSYLRLKQLEHLTDIIKDIQKNDRSWPVILMGDLNIYSTRTGTDFSDNDAAASGDVYANYKSLLDLMSGVDMQDAWQTYGGPGRRTLDGKCEDHICPDGAICHCADFHTMGGARIDYVFIEKPKSSHPVHLDLSRMWRTGWQWGDPCYTQEQVDKYKDLAAEEVSNPLSDSAWRYAFAIKDDPLFSKAGRLTDHHGIGFELLTSPKK